MSLDQLREFFLAVSARSELEKRLATSSLNLVDFAKQEGFSFADEDLKRLNDLIGETDCGETFVYTVNQKPFEVPAWWLNGEQTCVKRRNIDLILMFDGDELFGLNLAHDGGVFIVTGDNEIGIYSDSVWDNPNDPFLEGSSPADNDYAPAGKNKSIAINKSVLNKIGLKPGDKVEIEVSNKSDATIYPRH